ncbi:MAG TPA: lytic transglycosylase domain-containing protein, partial [Candidatus Atribacteria bacterium]|nr:lytic transglycosylase domain-containing protein [Candidatus Atribacteria bacterium]
HVFEYITQYNKAKDISNEIIYGIIETESARQVDAISSSGAKGLMQLKEIVFKDVNKYYNSNYDFKNVLSPSINITVGSLYLQRWFNTYISQKYTHCTSLYLTILTYAWGYGNVGKWLNGKNDNAWIKKALPTDKQEYLDKVMWRVINVQRRKEID